MRKHNFHFVSILVILSIFLTGCAGGAASRDKTKEAVVADSVNPGGLDVHQTGAGMTSVFLSEPILWRSPDFQEYVPNVASAYKLSDDGLELRLTFDPSLKFYNGDPLTLDDVVFSFQWSLDHSAKAGPLHDIDTITIDGQDVVLKLKQPSPALMVYLTDYASGIVQSKAAKSMTPEEFNLNPVQYGTMYPVEWVQGYKLVLKRNPYFKCFNPFVKNKGPVAMETITVRYIMDGMTIMNEFMAGNLDFVPSIPSEMVPQVMSNPKIKVNHVMSKSFGFVTFNPTVAPLDDVRVRKAMAMAIDRDELAAYYGGPDYFIPLYGLITPAGMFYSQQTEDYVKSKLPFDLSAAKALMAEAGWKDSDADGFLDKDGKKLQFKFTATPMAINALLASQWKRLGVEVKIEEIDYVMYGERIKAGNYEISQNGSGGGDPSVLATSLMEYKGLWDETNPAIQAWVDVGHEIDPAKRSVLTAEAVKAIETDQVLVVGLIAPVEYNAAQSYVTGMVETPSGYTWLYLNDLNNVANLKTP